MKHKNAQGKVERVVYLVESALSPRNRDRFGVMALVAKGLEVTVLDVGLLTLPEITGDRTVYAGYEGFQIRAVDSLVKLRAEGQALASADFIVCLVGTNYLARANLPVYRAITRSKTPYLLVSTNAHPGWQAETIGVAGAPSRLTSLIRRLMHADIGKSILARLPVTWLGVQPATFIVYGGQKSRGQNRFVSAGTTAIKAYAMDFEIYRQLKAESPRQTNTAVFIDEFRPYHPDNKEWGVTYTPEQAEYYFTRLRGVFDRVERELGLEVVVAAMPKSDYSAHPGVYGDRRIEYQQTARLIAQSKLVLAHRSTAIGLAVLFERPVLQIATRDIYQERFHKPAFDAFAKALGKSIQFCDDPGQADLSQSLDLNARLYGQYVRDYITETPDAQGSLWEIVLKNVEDRLGGEKSVAY